MHKNKLFEDLHHPCSTGIRQSGAAGSSRNLIKPIESRRLDFLVDMRPRPKRSEPQVVNHCGGTAAEEP